MDRYMSIYIYHLQTYTYILLNEKTKYYLKQIGLYNFPWNKKKERLTGSDI